MADEKTLTQAEMDKAVEDATAGLTAKRDELLGEVRGLKKRLKAFDGIEADDLDRLKKLAKDAEDAEGQRARQAGDWEKREQQLADKHARELQTARDEAAASQRTVERYLMDTETLQAIGGKGSARLLLPVVKPRLKVVKGEDGELGVRVLDAEGNVRVKVVNGKAVPLSVSDYVTELREDPDLAGAFAGSGASGSGAARSDAGGGAARTIPAGDDKAFLANLDKIAKGEVVVS